MTTEQKPRGTGELRQQYLDEAKRDSIDNTSLDYVLWLEKRILYSSPPTAQEKQGVEEEAAPIFKSMAGEFFMLNYDGTLRPVISPAPAAPDKGGEKRIDNVHTNDVAQAFINAPDSPFKEWTLEDFAKDEFDAPSVGKSEGEEAVKWNPEFLWDDYSETIGDSISDAEYWSGRTVMERGKFLKALAEYSNNFNSSGDRGRKEAPAPPPGGEEAEFNEKYKGRSPFAAHINNERDLNRPAVPPDAAERGKE